jgi:very-short-patch-repair endonuclease
MDGIIWRRSVLRNMRPDQFNALVKVGRLRRVFHGLYVDVVAVAAVEWGAVLRRAGLQFADGERPADSDESSYLCCWSAAEEWDLPVEAANGVSVGVPRKRTVSKQDGLTIHRHDCAETRIAQRGGVRVVPLELAVVQAFRALPKDARRQLVIRSVQANKVYADRVRPYISRTTPHRAELLELLALAEAGGHSELEIKALKSVFRRFGIQAVFRQQFATAIPGRSTPMDFAAPDLHLNIEADGSKYHSSPERRSADVRRDLDLSRHRWKVLRCLYENVVDEPERVAAAIIGALLERGWTGRPTTARGRLLYAKLKS